MDKQVKAQWLTALRSGHYKQGHEWLRRNNAYCCLGVLCNLYDATQWRPSNGNGELYSYGGVAEEYIYPPNAVWQWAGIDPEVDAEKVGADLALLNDEKEMSFDQIADYIAANL